MAGMKTKIVLGVPAAVLAAGLGFTASWEGTETTPYWDDIGKAWTVCTGETKVEMRKYTLAECEAMFAPSWAKYYKDLLKCAPALAKAPPAVAAMATDLAYNAGTLAVCNSKVTGGALKAGRWRDFCNALPSWSKAKGAPVRGLWNRRKAAQDVCLSGL